MNRTVLTLVATSVAWLSLGCTGDDITYGPADAAPTADATTDVTAPDGGLDASAAQPSVLVTHTTTAGELVAVNPQDGGVSGRLAFPGFGVVVPGTSGPYLLQEGKDVVTRLDPAQPWKARSSWSVGLGDQKDGGESYADPVQVVQVAPDKAYVLRYNRNAIAVIDPSADVDGGAPKGTIDLSALQQPNDGDGHVDMSGAVYDATRHRLYVTLANIDVNDVDPQGYFLLCAGTKSTLVAIDTTTDALVDLGGAGPGGGVVLDGYAPQMGILGGLILDEPNHRVLVFDTGCNQPGDAGPSGLVGRLIESVDLDTNGLAVLLDATLQDYPGQLVYQDAHHAIVQFGFGAFAKTYRWDPTTTTLGAPLGVAPDLFALDLAGGRIVGPRSTTAADGGAGPRPVIGVDVGDGGVSQLADDPFLEPGGYFGDVLYYAP